MYKYVVLTTAFLAKAMQLAKHPIGELRTDEESFKALLVKVGLSLSHGYTQFKQFNTQYSD